MKMNFILVLVGLLWWQTASANDNNQAFDPNAPLITDNENPFGTMTTQSFDPSQPLQTSPFTVTTGQPTSSQPIQTTNVNQPFVQPFGSVQSPGLTNIQVPSNIPPTSVNQPIGVVQTPVQSFGSVQTTGQPFGVQPNVNIPSNFGQPTPVSVDGPPSPLVQPTDAIGSTQAETVAHKLQKLLQLHDTTRDTYRSCVINKDVTDNLVRAYIGRAQNIANQITADPVLTPAKKTELKGNLDTFAKAMVAQVNSNFAALVNSKYGQSLNQNIKDVLNIDATKVILNYLAGIEAKMNEQTAACNNLNANFYAKAINDYTINLNKVVSVFKQLNPSAGNSPTSGVITPQTNLH